MSEHLVRISLRGCNEFTEVFHGATRNDAVRAAKVQYPDHRKIWCVGEATKKSKAADCSPYQEFDYGNSGSVDQGPVGGFVSSAASSVSNTVSEAEGGGLLLLLFVGGGAALAALAVAMLTFPVWLGGLTAKASHKLYNRFNPNPKMALGLLLATSTFAGGVAGAVAIQNEYMPELTRTQVEAIEHVMNQGN